VSSKDNKIMEKGVLTAIIAMLIDQLHKFYMIEILGMETIKKIEVTNFFNLVMVWNRGISFGMFQGYEYSNYFFMGFSSIIILLIFYMMSKSQNLYEALGFGMVIGGALGNVIDRITYSAVADFFDVHYKDYHWPAFNVADSCVFVGATLLIISNLFLIKKDDEKNEK